MKYREGESVLKVFERFGSLGGTNTTEAVRRFYPVYAWNLAGHRVGHGESGTGNSRVFGGLSDAAFRMVQLLEAGSSSDRPWLR